MCVTNHGGIGISGIELHLATNRNGFGMRPALWVIKDEGGIDDASSQESTTSFVVVIAHKSRFGVMNQSGSRCCDVTNIGP